MEPAQVHVQVRIALVHAVQVAMGPVERAFQQLWPEVLRTNVLDDALPGDLERAGALTPGLSERIYQLADYGVRGGADGVLFTCSAFGDAIEAAASRLAVPVLKPNEAMFEAALDAGRRIGMLATFAPAVESMEAEFREMARRRGADAAIETYCVPGAIAAARAGDIKRHDSLVAEAAVRLSHCDAVMLAHFSTSTALPFVQQQLAVPVLSAPEAAVVNLRRRVAEPARSSY